MYIYEKFEYERYTPKVSINEKQYQQILNIITKIAFGYTIYFYVFNINDLKERKKNFIEETNTDIVKKYVPDLNKYLDSKDYKSYADLVYKVYDKWWERSDDELMNLWTDCWKPLIVLKRLMVDNKKTYMENINIKPSTNNIDKGYNDFFNQCYIFEGVLSMLWKTYTNWQIKKKEEAPEIFKYISDKYLINKNDFLNLFKIGYNPVLDLTDNFIDIAKYYISANDWVGKKEINELIKYLKEKFPSITEAPENDFYNAIIL